MLLTVAIVALSAGGVTYMLRADGTPTGEATGLLDRVGRWFGGAGSERGTGRGGAGSGTGGFGGRAGRIPMTVEMAPVTRANMAERLIVVGNLVGAVTVEAGPKVAGRLEAVFVRLGDQVAKGQKLAKIEDSELIEQIRQAEASHEVAAATIRQREADLRLAQTNLERSRNLYERQLIPKQTFDDTDARYLAAMAQLDLAKAQHAQNAARLDELKINLANTVIVSPVSGFVGKRVLDPGAWVTPNTAFLSVVDIGVVRLVANIVERDLRKVRTGMAADVAVDAFPNEAFAGRIAHLAPILDPATRTAPIEIEIDNPRFRLKPGMYARVEFTVERRDHALVVPTSAMVDLSGTRGVFMRTPELTAKFHPVTFGLIDQERAEVASGLSEGDEVVTTGAAALREGDPVLLKGEKAAEGRGGRGGERAGGRGVEGEVQGSPGTPGTTAPGGRGGSIVPPPGRP